MLLGAGVDDFHRTIVQKRRNRFGPFAIELRVCDFALRAWIASNFTQIVRLNSVESRTRRS
jgi:hypothetical protein